MSPWKLFKCAFAVGLGLMLAPIVLVLFVHILDVLL